MVSAPPLWSLIAGSTKLSRCRTGFASAATPRASGQRATRLERNRTKWVGDGPLHDGKTPGRAATHKAGLHRNWPHVPGMLGRAKRTDGGIPTRPEEGEGGFGEKRRGIYDCGFLRSRTSWAPPLIAFHSLDYTAYRGGCEMASKPFWRPSWALLPVFPGATLLGGFVPRKAHHPVLSTPTSLCERWSGFSTQV